MNIKPAIRYQSREYFVASLIFLSINFLVPFLIIISLLSARSATETSGFSSVSYSGYEMACWIFFFVFGILLPRQATRICVQFGVSRRTAFLSLFPPLFFISLIMALAQKGIFLILDQISNAIHVDMQITYLFKLLYLDGNNTLTLTQHGQEILFHLFYMIANFSLGLFFTFLFWRLNKIGCIIAGLAIPATLIGIPFLIELFPTAFAPVISLAKTIGTLSVSSPWWAILFALLLTLFFSVVSWLLIRRTNIRGSTLTSK